MFVLWSLLPVRQSFWLRWHRRGVSVASMPFLFSETHSSLTCVVRWGLAGTRRMLQSSLTKRLLPRIRDWIEILQWWLSLYAHLLQANRNQTTSCVLYVLCCIIWNAHSLGEAIAFACSYRINLAMEKKSSSLIQFPDGSSQLLGKPTLQLVTLSTSEALLEFQPMKWEPCLHLGQSSTLLQSRRFLGLPIGSIISVPFQWLKPQ